jgi:hypothetical protein
MAWGKHVQAAAGRSGADRSGGLLAAPASLLTEALAQYGSSGMWAGGYCTHKKPHDCCANPSLLLANPAPAQSCQLCAGAPQGHAVLLLLPRSCCSHFCPCPQFSQHFLTHTICCLLPLPGTPPLSRKPLPPFARCQVERHEDMLRSACFTIAPCNPYHLLISMV